MTTPPPDPTRPKPEHLGPEYAAQFRDRSVVDAYRHRPPYPAPLFDLLADLIVDEPRTVLDAGCGSGDLARRLVDRVDRVDALDISPAIIERGRTLPNGDHPNLVWLLGAAEDAPLHPPYALVTAGSSLHWMEWSIVLPRFRNALTPRGSLAIVGQEALPTPWDAALGRLIDEYSTNRDYQPYDLVAELTSRRLFRSRGQHRTEPMPFAQSAADYVESIHSRNGFSRQRMGAERAAAFDAAVQALLREHCPTNRVELSIVGTVVWGQAGPV